MDAYILRIHSHTCTMAHVHRSGLNSSRMDLNGDGGFYFKLESFAYDSVQFYSRI